MLLTPALWTMALALTGCRSRDNTANVHVPANVDIAVLAQRESEQVDWKANVADEDDDALTSESDARDHLKRELLELAVNATHELRDARRLALELKRHVDSTQALEFIDDQLARHPEWNQDPGMMQLHGDALIGQAKRCAKTAENRKNPQATRQRAWRECQRFLDDAERRLRRAMSLAPEPPLAAQIEANLKFLDGLRMRAGRSAR